MFFEYLFDKYGKPSEDHDVLRPHQGVVNQMSDSFAALVVNKTEDGKQVVGVQRLGNAELMAGDTTIAVEYSSINYKDALAITGSGPIVRRFPLIPGIDFAGTVLDCSNGRFSLGDRVVLNGFGVGEGHHGGLAARARVSSNWLVPLPEGLSTKQAMIIGTAGYTAALSVIALRREGVTPAGGEVLVTGAAGGVGGIATVLLSRLGYRVIASSRRAKEEGAYLSALGAAEIIDASTLSVQGRPLAKERWAGAVDSIGSHTLASVLAATRYGGAVTACGLAQGADLPSTVMPFILRGVRLLGIDSVMAPIALREEAWALLAQHLDAAILDMMSVTISLNDVPAMASALLARSFHLGGSFCPGSA
jgi:acrylyl-CoA reductase (NADPH)